LIKHASPSPLEILVRKIGSLSGKTGVPAYAVGGDVRDRLLGISSSEVDFVVVGNGPDFANTAKNALGGGGYVVYEKFGTASFLVGDFKFEFVTARSESYRGDSRNPDVSKTDLATDLSRRDFTVNAMAMEIAEGRFGEIIDPHGGRDDLKKKMLRTPLDPEKTFEDDPLRIMRAARFAGQLAFHLHPSALEAMEARRRRLEIVSQERISDELLKILSHPKPSIGFRILKETRVLEIVFPEMAAMIGVEQRDDCHHKDVFEHTLKVLDNLAKETGDPLLRFAGLVHDIGKPRVKRFVENVGWTFHNHEQVGERMLKKICARLKLPNEYLKYGEELIRLHMRPIQLISEDVTDSAVRRLLFNAGERIDDLLTLCRADITSGNPNRVKQHMANFRFVAERMKEVEEKDRMRAFQSPVRGDEIMDVCGLAPGPVVGKIKKRIEEAILDGVIPNEHDAAYGFLLKIKDEILKNPY
jgi:poly(A) polymerase